VQSTRVEVAFSSLDGLRLRGTVVQVVDPSAIAVLTHGGGVTREEGGFFSRLALVLADAGISSLRFDFRGHGESDGQQQDLTLAGVANDVRAAVDYASQGGLPVALLAASFSGGLAALYAARHSPAALVLLNPLLNYKRRFIDDKPYWCEDYLREGEAAELARAGALQHSASFQLGRALLNEVFYFDPQAILSQVAAPTLIMHGTRDTFIPVESSRVAVNWLPNGRLVEIEGAQHGFAVHDDPTYRDPQTQQWQAFVASEIASWIANTVRE